MGIKFPMILSEMLILFVCNENSFQGYSPVSNHGYYAPNLNNTINRNGTQEEISTYGIIGVSTAAISYEAGLVFAFDDNGDEVWRLPAQGRTVTSYEDIIIFTNVDNSKSLVISDINGNIISNVDVNDDIYMIYFDGDYLAIGSKDFVKLYDVTVDQLKQGIDLTSATPIKTIDSYYSRGMDINGDTIVVASTFSHEVKTTSFSGMGIESTFDFFYPNDVDFINNDTVLVTEEHMNRIVSLDINAGDWKTKISAPHDIFWYENYHNVTAEDRAQSEEEESRSKASDIYSGYDTLYAPNGLDVYVNDGKRNFIVSDTDNNRINFYDENYQIRGTIVGINNVSNSVHIK